jgi:hypothetical protein
MVHLGLGLDWVEETRKAQERARSKAKAPAAKP